MDMRVNIAGLELSNPVMTASGTFGYGVEFKRYGQLEKLGGMVVKGLSLEPRAGNPMPRIADAPAGMLNAIGLQNIGARNFVEKRLKLLPWGETAVVANLYACSASEFADLAAYLSEQEGIAALEVNISCPNVSSGGVLFGQDPSMAAAVTRAVKDRSGEMPVIVKLTPNVTDIASMAKAVVDAGADAVSLINTLSAMSVDARTRKPRLANVIGGLSGPAIKPVALRCVWQVAQAVDVPIIGMGGITSAEDVLEFILVGATAVQVGTANFIRPDFAFRLVDELAALVDELGIESWDDYRGSLQV
ncbi:dihydroorotate dehydrogenase [Desulfovibrio ferrophilus]|uniref:Dihydroorotate dehydrogenase n=1 Tax=Desulfovibrio ferrophilus TaxID=241368 RepID=A0A2Z6AV26_9BACT|nr:dihydroorotate dehydrogenase [Desulfovibrio ferrophilus]BBD07084.1 dihydroorotate dehydrogenase [Desulfovibrio ferrophilus]